MSFPPQIVNIKLKISQKEKSSTCKFVANKQRRDRGLTQGYFPSELGAPSQSGDTQMTRQYHRRATLPSLPGRWLVVEFTDEERLPLPLLCWMPWVTWTDPCTGVGPCRAFQDGELPCICWPPTDNRLNGPDFCIARRFLVSVIWNDSFSSDPRLISS